MARSDVIRLLEGMFGAQAPACLERLTRLIGLWQRFGRVMNLTASLEESRLWEQVGEALLGVGVMIDSGVQKASWIDVGSGAGFPGLVMAVVLDSNGCLVEPRKKRFDFLDIARGQLGLVRLRLVNGRVEPGWEAVADRWAVASARAVWEPEVWLSEAQALLEPQGICLVHLQTSALDTFRAMDRQFWELTSVRSAGSWSVVGMRRGSLVET